MILEFFDVNDTARLKSALAIRERVFVEEQNVPLDLELDEHDRTDLEARHALVVCDGEFVGTGRYYRIDERAVQIGRLAVLPAWRRHGAGRLLLQALLGDAAARGYTRAHLLAQTHALEFYRHEGFSDDGAPVWDAGILHQPMSRIVVWPEC